MAWEERGAGLANEHGAFLVTALVFGARDQDVQEALLIVALLVVVQHVQEPDRAAFVRIVMYAVPAVRLLIGHSLSAIAEVAHQRCNPRHRRLQ